MNKVIDIIIESMQPRFDEMLDNSQFNWNVDYACELDDLSLLNYIGEDKLVDRLNKKIRELAVTRAEHQACLDVATTIENLIPEFKGRFKYE